MRQRLTIVLALIALGASAFLASCEKTEGNSDGKVGPTEAGPPPPDLGTAPPTGVVTFKKSGESGEVDFAQGSEFLIIPYSVSDVAATAIAFDIKITAGGAGKDGGLGSQSFPVRFVRRPLQETNPVLWARWQRRLAVESFTRGLAEQAVASLRRRVSGMDTPLAGATCKLSADCDPNEVCNAGKCAATLTLKTEAFSATKTIDVDVKKKGKIAALLLDKADTAPADTELTAMLEKFEQLIQPRSVALFGDPALKAGVTQTSSDRNADGLVWLVLTSKVKEKKAVGFFVATDFTDEAKSNKADILYVDSAAKPKDTYPIMAHEFQHLLNFGAKVYRAQIAGGQGALEALWLDEGQAHFAEDACGFGGENVLLLNQEVFPNFSDTPLFESAKDGLPMRGMAFTFVRYLFEQKGGVSYNGNGTLTDKGGAALLKGLHTTDKQGAAAVAALSAPQFADAKAVFDGWVAAVALDGRGVTTYGKYVFAPLIDDPVTKEQVGVKIRGSRKDNTGVAVKLEGPIEEDITASKSGTIPNATAKFYLLRSKTGKVSVSVTSKDSDFRFALIKAK